MKAEIALDSALRMEFLAFKMVFSLFAIDLMDYGLDGFHLISIL